MTKEVVVGKVVEFFGFSSYDGQNISPEGVGGGVGKIGDLMGLLGGLRVARGQRR